MAPLLKDSPTRRLSRVAESRVEEAWKQVIIWYRILTEKNCFSFSLKIITNNLLKNLISNVQFSFSEFILKIFEKQQNSKFFQTLLNFNSINWAKLRNLKISQYFAVLENFLNKLRKFNIIGVPFFLKNVRLCLLKKKLLGT